MARLYNYDANDGRVLTRRMVRVTQKDERSWVKKPVRVDEELLRVGDVVRISASGVQRKPMLGIAAGRILMIREVGIYDMPMSAEHGREFNLHDPWVLVSAFDFPLKWTDVELVNGSA